MVYWSQIVTHLKVYTVIRIYIITTTPSESGIFEICFVNNTQYYQRLSIHLYTIVSIQRLSIQYLYNLLYR